MTKKHLNRRLVLRGALATGAAIALPLPILEGMLNSHGTAFAAGEPLPKRFLTWFFGNGILPPRWNPARTGSDWQISDQLAPLASVKEYLTVVSGLVNKFPGTAFHPIGSAASTTGGSVVSNSAVEPSIDQRVAATLQSQGQVKPQLKSLELGVSDAIPGGPENTLHAVSHSGRNAPNYPEFDPRAAFTRLFGQVASVDESAEKKKQAERSVLDSVVQDAAELKPKLSPTDQARLEAHLDGIRQLEARLADLGTCNAPANPATQNVSKDTKAEAPKTVSDVVSEMAAIALSCSITHTASIVFTLPAAHVYYRHLGADMNDDFHDTICHLDAGDNTSQTRVHRGVVYAMECLATLLGRMKELPEGSGTLLDNSLVYVTSCTSWGKIHAANEWPVLLAGRAGGALPGNRHVRAPDENLSKVLFSIAQLMGAPLSENGGQPRLGANEGLVNSGLDLTV